MSAQQISSCTGKSSYTSPLQAATLDVIAQSDGICTRGMTRKMTLNAAASSLNATKVPTHPRTYTASSIMAAASAIIASNSPQHKRTESIEAINTPTSTKAISPKQAEVLNPCVVSVMTIGTKTLEEQMLEMRTMLEQVLKRGEEKDKKLDELRKEVIKLGKKKVEEAYPSNEVKDNDSDKIILAEEVKDQSGTCDEKRIHRMVAKALKTQISRDSSNNARYVKPYSKRIDSLRMPQGYQPPEFQQFDGSGNPKQHITHFVETCNNAGTEGDLLVKQFVRSLKGVAFNWYTDINAESIESWDQMEDEFLNRFYSARRVVSMGELTSTRQFEDEPVADYINRWRALSLECKERIRETSAVEMCIDGMKWELLYILKGIKPNSFQELATRAHDLEITMKEQIRKLADDGRFLLDNDESVESNHVDIATCDDPLHETHKRQGHMIQFRSLTPVEVWTHNRVTYSYARV